MRTLREVTVHGFRRAADAARAKITRADIWIQDHYRFVVPAMLAVLCAGTALLLWQQWEEVTGIARQVAPVFTIVSITASALLGVLAWFRKRRVLRLAAPTMPPAQQPDPRSES
ncbi:hypothetical protein [Streptomyces sp. NPDC005385]|uniref:hypothetical protein n=1 Tax=Streptomyces sp. NPDC005385 TaxID=3157039 RepID=UPI0033B95E04